MSQERIDVADPVICLFQAKYTKDPSTDPMAPNRIAISVSMFQSRHDSNGESEVSSPCLPLSRWKAFHKVTESASAMDD